MPSPKPPKEGDPDQPTTTTPAATTPRRPSATKQHPHHHHAASTPQGRKQQAPGPKTPKSDPFAATRKVSMRGGAAAAAAGGPKKPEPTLLGDFLLGRPSPARVAAARRRSAEVAALKAEMKAEMHQAAVRRVPPPGGVRDRVKAWQKSNAAAVAGSGGAAVGGNNPEEEPPSGPPTEVVVGVEEESVTEEDRVRIKMRQKARRKVSKTAAEEGKIGNGKSEGEGADDAAKGGPADVNTDEAIPEAPRPKGPPKKRIVSDEHWMKRRGGRKSPPRGAGAAKSTQPEGSPIPKNFLQRTAQNPTVQSKVKDWAMRVEVPESPPTGTTPKVKKYGTKSGETITVEEDKESSSTPSGRTIADDGIRVRPLKSRPADGDDDTIRVEPVRKKKANGDNVAFSGSEKTTPQDDGIRVRSARTKVPDDGIRVGSRTDVLADETAVRSASARRSSPDRSTRTLSAKQDSSAAARMDAMEEPGTEPDTPTRKPKARRQAKSRRSVTAPSRTDTQARSEDPPDDRSWSSVSGSQDDDSRDESDLPSSAPAKSLADIPVGYSAFSELDLPLGADHHTIKRPKAQRNPSFKAVPKVFKKVVSEGKKIIHDKVDPPRPVVNQPRSIESWLNTTVDPFVEASPAPKRKSVEKEWEKDTRKRTPSESRQKDAEAPPTANIGQQEDRENEDPEKPADKEEALKEEPAVTTPKSGGLKRSRATRTASSPRNPAGKKPLREALIGAFRGESTGHKLPPASYPSCQDDREPEEEDYHDHEDERRESRRKSSGSSRKRSPSPELPASAPSDASTEQPYMMSGALPKRKPPTNGMHELSTIVSMASFSTGDSDTLSTLSQTTITQSTALTRSTDSTRRKSHRSQAPGLKRRLTKHSDLVSVLSVPDSANGPERAKSIKSTRSLRRKTSKLQSATVDDLLREFADDEHFYQRELKTLVDGVIPVLLNQVVHSETGAAPDLFGRDRKDGKADTMGKSVVNMGIALEKLRSFHKRAPLHDPQRLLTWLESVSAVYNNYLDVWRLGFQGLIVNLAPAPGRPDDEDSLLNAMDRNEDGDVLNENGERVDVAYLLKRPLARIKGLLKFVKVARAIGVDPDGISGIVAVFEALLQKARHRHKEETARNTDEDANNTGTSGCLDLRNLVSVNDVRINRSRQVNAKDSFFLELAHSNGQKIACQVEVIFRDKPEDPADAGDILIRETGNGRASLLFPPIPASAMSARKGDEVGLLVTMVRGRHNGTEWHELLFLSADNDEQVADWLDILGSKPVPPTSPQNTTTTSDATTRGSDQGTPIGEGKLRKRPVSSPSPVKPAGQPEESPKIATPSRLHKRNPSVPTTPTSTSATLSASPSSSEKTFTQESYLKSTARHPLPVLPTKPESRPLKEDMRPDPARLAKSPPNTTPFRDDGAPPPPVHRTMGSKKPAPITTPPVDLAASRVKRRTSSPLKHEYHPSDISSSDSESDSATSSDSESSSDELDEDEVPEPLPGISIKNPEQSVVESVVSESSLTPSNSASQAGAPGFGRDDPKDVVRSIASISYWSNKKGQWKDVWHEACSVVIGPGLIEAHPLNAAHLVHTPGALQSSGSSEVGDGEMEAGAVRPLIALDLTPLVMIRQSTMIDLEIRSPVRSYSKLKTIDGTIFRFRAPSAAEGTMLYGAVHHSRMNNAKFKALEEEARFRSFGEHQQAAQDADGQSGSSRRRSWFGRRNSYRASTRAPSQSQGSSSGVSAPSLLKRLTGGGNLSFNIDRSSVDRQAGSRPGSASAGSNSLYTSGSSSAGGTPLRSPSVSIARSGASSQVLGSDNLKIRCHLLVSASKWEDHGNCNLTITRPPPGMRQELRVYHGMEKRVIVTTIPKKKDAKEAPLVVLDVVLGSKCFGRLGSRGIILNVWEDLRDEQNRVGSVPASGALSGKVKKWCFQCGSAQQANWIFGLVAQEVVIG